MSVFISVDSERADPGQKFVHQDTQTPPVNSLKIIKVKKINYKFELVDITESFFRKCDSQYKKERKKEMKKIK